MNSPVADTQSVREFQENQYCDTISISALRKVTGFSRQMDTNCSNSATSSPFIWSGTYTIQSGKREDVVSALTDFAPQVGESEPDTWSYLVFESLDDGDENTLYLWELYANENGLREVHVKSDAAANLKAKIGHLLIGRSLCGYRRISTKNSRG